MGRKQTSKLEKVKKKKKEYDIRIKTTKVKQECLMALSCFVKGVNSIV